MVAYSMLADEILEYISIEGFSARPKYNKELTIPKNQLGKIEAKYTLPRGQEAICGLNGCHTKHLNGFIISNAKGEETNCGVDCGERDFGVKFSEIRAVFERKIDAQARARYIVSLHQDADLKPRAETAYKEALHYSNKFAEITDELKKHRHMWTALIEVSRNGGLIRISVEDDSDNNERKTDRFTKAIIQSSHLIQINDVSTYHREIKFHVMPWIEEISLSKIQELDIKELEALSQKSSEMQGIIQKAEKFVSDATKFIAKNNLQNLEHIKDYLIPAKARINSLNRLIDRLINNAPE